MTLGPIGQKISAKLSAAFVPSALDVIDESSQHHGHVGARDDGESHFRVRIVAEAFRTKSRIEQHRMVNAVLVEELKDRVHALAIETTAPPAFIDLAPDDPRLLQLLAKAKLPNSDLAGNSKRYIGICDIHGKLLAAGGLEIAGVNVLLRSVAVNPDARGRKLGQTMVRKLLELAWNDGVREVYLLTNTAMDFFAILGFKKISRDQVPAPLAATSQFSGAACAAAQAMRARLAPAMTRST